SGNGARTSMQSACAALAAAPGTRTLPSSVAPRATPGRRTPDFPISGSASPVERRLDRSDQYPLDGVVAVAELVPFGLVGPGPPLEISRAANEEVPAPHFRRPAKLEAAPGVRQRGAHETGRVALAIDFDVDTSDPVAAPRETRKEDASSG